MSAPDNLCGSCTACCRVYAIPEFKKPAGKWCEHCAVGKGCKIYQERPERCQTFECFWLQAEKRGQSIGDELRPDRCKVVFSPTTNERVMTALTLPGRPDAWRAPAVWDIIGVIRRAGVAVAVGGPAALRQLVFYPDGSKRTVRMSEPDKDGMQWCLD